MELIYRIKGILVAPDTEWARAARAPTDVGGLMIHVALLAAIPAVARFLGDFLIGAAAEDGSVLRVTLDAGLAGAALDYAFSFVAVAVVALAIDLMAPWFGGRPRYADALKVAVYAFTPYWILGLFLVFPGLRFLTVFGVYALFLARSGLVRVMHARPDGALRYAAVATALAVAVTVAAAQATALVLATFSRSIG